MEFTSNSGLTESWGAKLADIGTGLGTFGSQVANGAGALKAVFTSQGGSVVAQPIQNQAGSHAENQGGGLDPISSDEGIVGKISSFTGAGKNVVIAFLAVFGLVLAFGVYRLIKKAV